MKTRIVSLIASAAVTAMLATGLFGCSAFPPSQADSTSSEVTSSSQADSATDTTVSTSSAAQSATPSANAGADAANTQNQQGGFGGMNGMDTQPGQTNDNGYTANDNGIAINTTLNPDEAFTDRDLAQEADTANAQQLTVTNGQNLTVSAEGVYVVKGTAANATIVVEANDTAKVQLVLDGVSITNTSAPAIYVKSADKVFVTLVGENTLATTGEFVADGDTNLDAVIFSKDDLCLNGTGSLTVNSSDHAIVSKDDLKVTGGTYTINATGNGLRANDSVRIAGGTFAITAEDGIKAKNDDDNELGYVYIKDGSFDINATDNGIQGYAFVWIDGGTFKITSEECIEGTYIQINGGTLEINASDDGINASIKSSVYTPTIDITGGEITVNMGQGDTDALDSNGYLYIKGGKVDISAQFPFDYAWGAEMTGGEVYVNGQQVTEITESMMGPGGGGGMGGNMGGGTGGQMPDGQTPPDGQMPQDGQMPNGQTPPDGGFGGHGGPHGGGRPSGEMPPNGAAPMEEVAPTDGQSIA